MRREPAPRPLTADEATAVADAVSALPDVAGLDAGRFGEVAMLFARTRVPGLRERDGRLEVHVRLYVDVTAPRPLHDVLAHIGTVAARALGDRSAEFPVDVIAADAEPVGGPAHS